MWTRPPNTSAELAQLFATSAVHAEMSTSSIHSAELQPAKIRKQPPITQAVLALEEDASSRILFANFAINFENAEEKKGASSSISLSSDAYTRLVPTRDLENFAYSLIRPDSPLFVHSLNYLV